MPGPTLTELIANVPSGWPVVHRWIDEHAEAIAPGDAPLDARALLDLVYDLRFDVEEDEVQIIVEWFDAATAWGLARLVEREGIDGERWCREAVRSTWALWSPLAPHAANVVAVATDASADQEALERARDEYRAFPSHGAPPPWIGHFHGALASLLQLRLTKQPGDLAECLVRACVAPDGTRRAEAIATCRF